MQLSRSAITGNHVRHQGVRGIGLIACDDSVIADNVVWDTPWMNVIGGQTTIGNLCLTGGNRNLIHHNHVMDVLALAFPAPGLVLSATGDENILDSNTFQGTFGVAQYRFDAATVTNTHLVGYHGETISNNGGTYSIEGGKATFAQVVTAGLAPQNGSFVGCSDCTPASPCVAGGGGGSILKRQGAAWNCP